MSINYNKMFNDGKRKVTSEKTNKPDEIIGIKATMAILDEETTKEVITPPPKPIDYKVDRCTHLNLRVAPNKDCDVITILRLGDLIQVENIADGWAHVYTTAGLEGYVMEDFIKEV